MDIQSLPLPENLIASYARSGIRELYPPQADCVEKGLLDGKNMLVSVPTASGKTIIAEMAMHRHIAGGGKCLYIVPLKALANEKFAEFSGKGVRVAISTGDYDRRDENLGRSDIIVATSEKVDSLLRNSSSWIHAITLTVIDEVHLVDSPDRGPTLEMVITKLRYKNPEMQLVGLSATIGNPGNLAEWLGAELVTSAWRPVELREGVYFDGCIRFRDGTRDVDRTSKYEDLNLCMDTVREGGQCLVFVSSRRNAEGFAKRAAAALKCESAELEEYAGRLKALAETDSDRTLAACVARGAAFHHAGLTREERSIVETGFRQGNIKCISSTPTLAAGLNLPARRVIIRDYLRFSSGEGMTPIPAREYHQMAGRAGRPHLDPYGEAVLIAKGEEQVDTLFDCYIDAPPEEVHSQCARGTVLCSHILSLLASGFARSIEDIDRFMERSYYLHEHRGSKSIHRATERVLAYLRSAEMITDQDGRLSSTEFGSLVSQLYVSPVTAEGIVAGMMCAKTYSDIGLVQLICSTPDMPTLYVSNKDLFMLDRFLDRHTPDLWVPVPDENEEEYYRGLKTTMLIRDWTDELPEAMIAERYGVGGGDLYNTVENIGWLLHAAIRLSGMFPPGFTREIRELEACVRYGIRRELLPLVRLRGIGRVRARRLFNNGLTTPSLLLDAGIDSVASIIGRGMAAQIFRQLEGQKETGSSPDEDPHGQSTLFRFG